MSVAIFSEVLPLFRSFVLWYKMRVSSDISYRRPFTWCIIPFVEASGINLTETLDFIPLFKRHSSTCFFLGIFMGFELFEGFLCRAVLLSFNFFLLLLFAIACKLSSRVCQPEDLHLLFSVKSIVELCVISRRVLDGSLVFDELCVDKVDGRCWFSVIVFIIWVLVKFSFLRYISSSFKDSATTEWFGVTFWPCKSSIIFFIKYSSSLMKDFKACSSLRSCLLWIEFSLECEVWVTDVIAPWIVVAVLLETENCDSWNKSKFESGRVSSALEIRGVSSSSSSLGRVFVSFVVRIL